MTVSQRRFAALLGLLVVIRLIMVGAMLVNVPPTIMFDGVRVGKMTGDERWYYELATSLLSLKPAISPYTLGFPLWMIPFILACRASEVADIIQPLMIANAALLFPLAIILMGLTGLEVFNGKGRHTLALLLAALFTALPYLFYALFRNLGPYYGQVSRGVYQFVSISWADSLSDPLSAFLLILAFYLLLRELKEPRLPRLILLGAIMGLATMVRPNNAVSVAVFGLALLAKRRFRGAFVYVGAVLLAFAPQLAYNQAMFDSPLTTGVYGYHPEGFWQPEPGSGLFSLQHLWHFLSVLNQYFPLWFLLLPLLLAGLACGVAYFWRQDRITAVLILLWPFANLLFYSVYNSGLRNVRYLLPVIPPLLMLGIGCAVVLCRFALAITWPLLRGRPIEQDLR